MRIAFYGNVANNLYLMARCLRERRGFDIDLFIGEQDVFTMKPESDDPDLADGCPDWIHSGNYNRGLARVHPRFSPLVRELRAYDFVVVSYNGPAFAQFAGVPWAFYSAGADLTTMPFPWRFRSLYRSVRRKALMHTVGAWQRRGIRRADIVWTQGFRPFQAAIDALGVDRTRVSDEYLPILMGDDLFSAGATAAISDPTVRALRDESDFILFHPSRLVVDDSPLLRATGEWKGNDRLVRGFASFARAGVAEAPRLVMPDRTTSADVPVVKRLVEELGIGQFVHWATPPTPEGFPRSQLYDWYRCADVVADDFGVGWFGSVVIEGLAFGKPVLCHVDEDVMDSMYPWHPIISTVEPDDIAAELVRLAEDPRGRAEIGSRGREWVSAHHCYDAVADRYASAFETVLERSDA